MNKIGSPISKAVRQQYLSQAPRPSTNTAQPCSAKNKVGPALNGVVGAPAGAVEGFKYSKAFVAAADDGLVWDDENLHAYLTKPRDFIKGNRMSFAGLTKEGDRDDVIAYLATFQ